MFKKIKENLLKKQEQLKKEQELKKAQSYYNLIKAGAAFIQFVQEDIKRNDNKMNRSQRRRMEKDIKDGFISEELVQHYAQQIDWVLFTVYNKLHPKVDKKNSMEVRNTPPPSNEKVGEVK